MTRNYCVLLIGRIDKVRWWARVDGSLWYRYHPGRLGTSRRVLGGLGGYRWFGNRTRYWSKLLGLGQMCSFVALNTKSVLFHRAFWWFGEWSRTVLRHGRSHHYATFMLRWFGNLTGLSGGLGG